MTVRILADREPYASYATKGDPLGSLSLFLCVGAEAEEGNAPADLEVLPAELFLAGGNELRPSRPVFAYGSVSLMAAAFDAGCADYLRDPWSLTELRARALRFEVLRFLAGGRIIELRGATLSLRGEPTASLSLNEQEHKLLGLLLRNAGTVVTRQAIAWELWGREGCGNRTIDAHITRLRARLESLSPGAGRQILSCRGLGYRIIGDRCG